MTLPSSPSRARTANCWSPIPLYSPHAAFAIGLLTRFGVTTRYYDPRIGAGIAGLITNQTCAVFMELPGSLTFELQDVPAIAAAAKARGVTTILDNTWSAGIYFKPFAHGVDLSVQALTKYQSGHADAFMGAVLCSTPEWAQRVFAPYKQLGLGASPDDSYLVLRGMRTLAVRLERQSASALAVARWLEKRPEVARVLHPAHRRLARSRNRGNATSPARRACSASCSNQRIAPASKRCLNSFRVFAIGFSWGGYESLAIHLRSAGRAHGNALESRRPAAAPLHRPRTSRRSHRRLRKRLRGARVKRWRAQQDSNLQPPA